jgi:C4-dicarboxylate-specific signal transduction histidine kinase
MAALGSSLGDAVEIPERASGARRGGAGGAALALAASLALVGAIAFADYFTGYEFRLAILYLVPIAWTAWRMGAGGGTLVSIVAAALWTFTFRSSHPYPHAGYFYLEGAVTGATFVIVVALVARLKGALDRADERFITVLKALDMAVQVEDRRTGVTLFANRRFRRAFEGGHAFGEATGEIFDPLRRRWYLVQSRPLRWIDGSDAILRQISDITDVRQARELVLRHREAAHRTARLVALGELASAIAHELNQPLAAIATYNNASLRLLQQGIADPAELQGAMLKCRDQARRAGAIIQSLRDTLRQPRPATLALDLNDVASSARELAEPEALELGVSLRLSLAPGLPPVRADRVLAEQVALNLVRNAIEAVQGMAPERRSIVIRTHAEPHGVRLTVEDSGPGVAEAIAGRLFDAFVTTKPGGLGLGLSICRSVVESMGGAIGHEQGAAQGARFWFSFPAAAEAP